MCYPCLGTCVTHVSGPYSEEGWLRHKENFGEAHLSAADGVVAREPYFGVNDHPGGSASTPPCEEGIVFMRLFDAAFSAKESLRGRASLPAWSRVRQSRPPSPLRHRCPGHNR